MRQTGRNRAARVRTTPNPPPAQARRASPRSARDDATIDAAATTSVSTAKTEVLLSPSGIFVTSSGAAQETRSDEHQLAKIHELAVAIRQRIESRLVGRIRNLAVRIQGNRIVLEGQCATYYSKQLAQHAALGVLEDEQLENAIEVMAR